MSNVNAGVFNFPQILRRLGHRTKQVRDVVFVRDAIFEKSVGTHIDTDGSPGGGAGRTTRLSGPPVNFGYENTNSTEAIAEVLKFISLILLKERNCIPGIPRNRSVVA